MTDKILHKTDWLTLVDRDGYHFVKDGNGVGVAILPFRALVVNDEDDEPTEFLARIEPTPSHAPNQNHLGAITGDQKEGEALIDAAIRELEEEAGFRATREMMIDLGKTYVSKALSTIVQMYAVDVSSLVQYTPKGDGSIYEEQAENVWLTRRRASMVPDSVYGTMMARITLWFRESLFG
jgi:8-oxo-dGTP pyrophosphatase MutT (NUDIX family)